MNTPSKKYDMRWKHLKDDAGLYSEVEVLDGGLWSNSPPVHHFSATEADAEKRMEAEKDGHIQTMEDLDKNAPTGLGSSLFTEGLPAPEKPE